MTTLAEINDTLVAQNAILSETNEGVKSTSSNIDKLVKQMAGDRMDALEDKAEERRITKRQSDVAAAKAASDSPGGFSLPSLPFGGLGKLFAAGSLVGLGAKLGKAFLKRGIPGAVLNLFADEIADYIQSKIKDPKEAKELSDAAFGAIKGLSIGMIFGKRFAFIGGILGGILSDEKVRKEFETLGKNLETELKNTGIDLPSFSETLKGITGTVTSALRTINSFFGDGKDANGKEIEKDFTAVAATLGGLAVLLAPGATFRVLLSSLGGLSSGIASLLKIGAGGKGGLLAAAVRAGGAGGAALLSPPGLAAMLAALVAGSIYFAVKSDQDDDAELKKLQDKINAWKQKNQNAQSVVPALTDDEWKRYNNLKSRKDSSSNVPTGGDPREDPEVGGMGSYEDQIYKFRYGNTDINVLDQEPFDLNKKFTGPAPLHRLTAQQRAEAAGMSRSAAAQLNYTAPSRMTREDRTVIADNIQALASESAGLGKVIIAPAQMLPVPGAFDIPKVLKVEKINTTESNDTKPKVKDGVGGALKQYEDSQAKPKIQDGVSGVLAQYEKSKEKKEMQNGIGSVYREDSQRASMTKKIPQTAPAVAEAANTATTNNTRPIIVQSNNNPISSTTVSSPQAFMAPAGQVFDMSDGYLIGRGFSR